MLTNEIPLGDNNGLWLFWVLLDDKKVLCAVYIHKTLVRCTGTFWSPCNKVARCSGQHHPGGHISSTHRPLIASHWVPLLHCLHSVSHHTLTHWCLTRHPNHYWHVSWNASIGNTLAGTSRTTATSPHSPVMQHVWMRKGSYTLWVSFRLSWSQSTSLPGKVTVLLACEVYDYKMFALQLPPSNKKQRFSQCFGRQSNLVQTPSLPHLNTSKPLCCLALTQRIMLWLTRKTKYKTISQYCQGHLMTI